MKRTQGTFQRLIRLATLALAISIGGGIFSGGSVAHAIPPSPIPVSTCLGDIFLDNGRTVIYPQQFNAYHYIDIIETAPGDYFVTVAFRNQAVVGGYQLLGMASLRNEERALQVLSLSVSPSGKIVERPMVLVTTSGDGQLRVQYQAGSSDQVAVWDVHAVGVQANCSQYTGPIEFDGVATSTMRVLTSSVEDALASYESLYQQASTATQLSADYALASDKSNRCLTALGNTRSALDVARAETARVSDAARILSNRIAAVAKFSRHKPTRRRLLKALKEMSLNLKSE